MKNHMEHEKEHPLKWPESWGRTLINQRKPQGGWRKTLEHYQTGVLNELSRFGASTARISYNDRNTQRMDPGVAVWYSLKPQDDFSWQSALQLENPAPTLEEIDKAYRRLIMRHHPDQVQNGSGGDVQVFHQLTEQRKRARAWVLGTNAPALDNCIPCDRFNEVRLNLAAVYQALRAFRQLERVGIPAILERVMNQSFKALPKQETINV